MGGSFETMGSRLGAGKPETINEVIVIWHQTELPSDRVEIGDNESIDVTAGNGAQLVEELKKRAGSISEPKELKTLAEKIQIEFGY